MVDSFKGIQKIQVRTALVFENVEEVNSEEDTVPVQNANLKNDLPSAEIKDKVKD